MKGKRILLIDDSKVSIAFFSDLLQKAGADTTSTTSPEQGIQYALEENFDCIITDYEMPSMSGLEVCEAIKTELKDRYVPVLMLTAKEEEEFIEKSLLVGANNFINKKEAPYIVKLKISSALELKELHDKVTLSKQSESIQSMITTYNHEFNNLLAILTLDIQLHVKKFHDGDDTTLQNIKKSTSRIQKLVEKIKDFDGFKDKRYTDGIQMVDLD